MIFWLQKTVDTLLLPPASLFILGLVGMAVGHRFPRSGRAIVLAALVSGYLLSTPFVSRTMTAGLEMAYVDPTSDARGMAIVVLGGGTDRGAPEYGADAPSHSTLLRIRYAAFLHRQLMKPVIVSGGSVIPGTESEADVMRRVLIEDFNVKDVRIESRSRTTRENARFSADLLLPEGVDNVYLVTDAWHMRRAVWSFENAGFKVIPAATGFTPARDATVRDFLPSAEALRDSSQVFHEIIGMAWYRLQSAVGR